MSRAMDIAWYWLAVSLVYFNMHMMKNQLSICTEIYFQEIKLRKTTIF